MWFRDARTEEDHANEREACKEMAEAERQLGYPLGTSVFEILPADLTAGRPSRKLLGVCVLDNTSVLVSSHTGFNLLMLMQTRPITNRELLRGRNVPALSH
eukprot:m51a1_g7486 hypothetical protein (101) ;mRNA; f:222228-222916